MSEPGDLDRRLEAYRREVLRWNAHFSLITRQRSSERLDALLRQSVAGAEALASALRGPAPLVDADGWNRLFYVDIGAGAGLPAIPWRLVLEARGATPDWTWLVEPRARRAWFLERAARQAEVANLSVLETRWGEAPLVPAPPGRGRTLWVVSLQLLNLDDAQVLEGWARAGAAALAPAAGVLVVRPRAEPDGVGPAASKRQHPGDMHCEPGSPEAPHARWLPLGAGTGALAMSFYSARDLPA